MRSFADALAACKRPLRSLSMTSWCGLLHPNRILFNFYRNLRWVQERVMDEVVTDGAFGAGAVVVR